MEYDHSHSHDLNWGNAFKIGITLNIIFIVVEAFYGYFSNSMALIADAGHNLSDVLALAFSWISIILSQRKPTLKFTYGFRRSTILIALLNTIILLVAVVIIAWQTIKRLGNPMEINSTNVIIRSAFTHFMADTLISLGVVVAGIIVAFTGIVWVDTLVSFIIVAVILYSSYHLLIDSVNLSLDAVPENIDQNAIREFLTSLPEVIEVHDLHIWALGTTTSALTVHMATNVQTNVTFITNIQHQLQKHFEIEHVTIQVEFGSENIDCETNCK
jgi:cobalt-zinc-cadmium efflux system protein